MEKNDYILLGITYSEYVPGMKIYLHKEYAPYKEGGIAEIKEVNGFDSETETFKFPKPRELFFFVTTDNVKVDWKEVPVSCCVERNETTTFIDNMFSYYKKVADNKLNDVRNYEWKQNDYDNYLGDKHGTLVEMLVEYEKQRIKGLRQGRSADK